MRGLRNTTFFELDIIETRPGIAVLSVTGANADSIFSNEAGGHRWQRVPPTERNGRVHTSTITVSVLPDEPDPSFTLDPAELEWHTTRGSGAGGQHRNKVETVVVVKHKPTGLTVRCETERSQHRNKQIAFRLLHSRIAEQQRKNAVGDIAAMRKSQIGSGMRGDKRRTIRVRDGQVTDHVTGRKWTYQDYVAGKWG